MKASGSRGDDRDEGEVEAAELSEMRSVWRAMRDEEPPARGLDALLAAAGAQAKRMRDRAADAPTTTSGEEPAARGLDALLAAADAPTTASGEEPAARGLDALLAAASTKAAARPARVPPAFAVGSLPPADEAIGAGARGAVPSAIDARAPRPARPVRPSRDDVQPMPTSLWQRCASAMRRPSVLALASGLILIGGALVVRHTAERSPVTIEARSSAPSPSQVPGGKDAQDASIERTQPASRPPLNANDDSAEAGAPLSRERVAAPAKTPKSRLSADAVDRADSSGAAGAAAPAPEVAVDPTKKARSSTSADAQPSRDALFRKAEMAAHRGDCEEARRLIAELARLADEYRARAARDATISRCMNE